MYREKIYNRKNDKFKRKSNEVLSILSTKAMSKHELAIVMGLSLSTVSNYVFFLKRDGLVYIADWISNPFTKPTAKYKFGTKPDAEYIHRKKHRDKPRLKKELPNKTNVCDIAASWMRNPIKD